MHGDDVPQPSEGVTRESINIKAPLTPSVKDQLIRETYPLITRPNSDLVRAMVANTRSSFQDFRDNYKWPGLSLAFLGVRMHIYADTWAHQDHIGSPDRRMNEVMVFSLTFISITRSRFTTAL